MMKIIRRQCALISLASLFIFVLCVNVYFIYVIKEEKTTAMQGLGISLNPPIPQDDINKSASNYKRRTEKLPNKLDKNKKPPTIYRNSSVTAAKKIYLKLTNLSVGYYKSSLSKSFLSKHVEDLKPKFEVSSFLWPIANSWVGPREIVPHSAPHLGSVLRTLCSTKIIRAENANRGTQLKLMLTLEGNQKAIFKPQWYSRDEIIDGPVYAGKDRHNAEVAAFHLSTLLGLNRCPPTVGRKINLRREVMAVASNNLIDTFYQEGNNTCFYGVCYYCSSQDPVCAKRDYMEGAVIMWLPETLKLKKYRNPWQRTYKNDIPARWEIEEKYCSRVKSSKLYKPELGPRLLDMIDAAVFDFLIDNGDRHHYEVFENFSNSVVILLDNGKSFGNPNQDHIDIMAPLYQCCMIRKSTWNRLKMFTGVNVLSSSLSSLLEYSHISPVLTASHLKALDRRLYLIYSAVEVCIDEHGEDVVLVTDTYS